MVLSCLLLLGGCVHGDHVAHRRITLTYPNSANRGDAAVLTSGADSEALEIIESVFRSNGIDHDASELAAEDRVRGVVALYGPCGVTVIDQNVTVGCVERNRERLSPDVAAAMQALQEQLTARYGSVEVHGSD